MSYKAKSVRVPSGRVPYDKREVGVYEARADTLDPVPQVLIIHEWWGLNDHIRDVMPRLAAEGYRAFAADLYDGCRTSDADEAARMMTSLDQAEEMLSSGPSSTGPEKPPEGWAPAFLVFAWVGPTVCGLQRATAESGPRCPSTAMFPEMTPWRDWRVRYSSLRRAGISGLRVSRPSGSIGT